MLFNNFKLALYLEDKKFQIFNKIRYFVKKEIIFINYFSLLNLSYINILQY